MQSYWELCSVVQSYAKLCKVIFTWLFKVLHSYLELCRIMQKYATLCKTIKKLCKVMQSNAKLYKVMKVMQHETTLKMAPKGVRLGEKKKEIWLTLMGLQFAVLPWWQSSRLEQS